MKLFREFVDSLYEALELPDRAKPYELAEPHLKKILHEVRNLKKREDLQEIHDPRR